MKSAWKAASGMQCFYCSSLYTSEEFPGHVEGCRISSQRYSVMNAAQMMRVEFVVKAGAYIFDITHRGVFKSMTRDQKSVDDFLSQL
jgi:hypothetical protein